MITGSPASRTAAYGIQSLFKFSISTAALTWSNLSPDIGTYTFPSAVVCTVKSNNPATTWYVSTYASGPLTSISRPTFSIPIAALKFKSSSASTYTTMTTAAQRVITGGVGNNTVNVDYQFTFGWVTEAISDYRATITYACTDTP